MVKLKKLPSAPLPEINSSVPRASTSLLEARSLCSPYTIAPYYRPYSQYRLGGAQFMADYIPAITCLQEGSYQVRN